MRLPKQYIGYNKNADHYPSFRGDWRSLNVQDVSRALHTHRDNLMHLSTLWEVNPRYGRPNVSCVNQSVTCKQIYLLYICCISMYSIILDDNSNIADNSITFQTHRCRYARWSWKFNVVCRVIILQRYFTLYLVFIPALDVHPGRVLACTVWPLSLQTHQLSNTSWKH